MTQHPKKSPATHTKRLARRYSQHSGLSYLRALALVRTAAEQRLLPEPLDAAGMDRAIQALDRYATATAPGAMPTTPTSTSSPSTATQGQRQGLAGLGDPLYLIPSFLTVLRKAWQGRMTWERAEGPRTTTRALCDSAPITPDADVILTLLCRDGYVYPLTRELAAGEWERIEPTDLGLATLERCRATADKFRDGLPAGVYTTEEHRRPYVGQGADGARRSAEIDRNEIDTLDLNDPQQAEHANYLRASISRWEQQAAALTQEEWARHMAADRRAARTFSQLGGAPSPGPVSAEVSSAWDTWVQDPEWLADFLTRCRRGTPTLIRHVGETLAAAGFVATDWHQSTHDRTQGRVAERLIRATRPVLGRTGELVLIDAYDETSEETFDWVGDDDKAARHFIHPDGRGITFCTPDGEPSRTHRIASPNERLTDMALVQARRDRTD